MTKTIRSLLAMAIVMSLAGAVCFAQSGGEATYKAKCAMCHGPAGTPSAGMAKMGVKPVSDPGIKALTEAQVIAAVKSGKGKMHPVAGLTDAQVKDVAAFFKSLK
ncbi:MAG: cytochrome c [Terracidiphilus sp.]|jgi:mono/diheme cytochrome c family protein